MKLQAFTHTCKTSKLMLFSLTLCPCLVSLLPVDTQILKLHTKSADIMTSFFKTCLNWSAINILPMCLVVGPVRMCRWRVFSL